MSRPDTPDLRVKQGRSLKTYNAFIETGFRLLEENEFESITISALAQSAGYSVGAFYARFERKDEFFEAMIRHHLENRSEARERLYATVSPEKLVDKLITELVTYYWSRPGFWRTALVHSMRNPGVWKPVLEHGRAGASTLIEWMKAQRGKALTKAQEGNIRFAFLMLLGMINSSTINRPGPVMPRVAFTQNLIRAFRAVSDYDRLMGIARPAD